jgi:hypothetical protein
MMRDDRDFEEDRDSEIAFDPNLNRNGGSSRARTDWGRFSRLAEMAP